MFDSLCTEAKALAKSIPDARAAIAAVLAASPKELKGELLAVLAMRVRRDAWVVRRRRGI
jgi:hypothetical protein